jgi:hypothetical protein
VDDGCPKCGEPRQGDSCPKCGLVFAKFDQAKLDAAVPGDIKQLWAHVEQDWDDDARHALFVERALAAGQGGYAAGCYRRKGDDPKARDQLARITSRLEQLLGATAKPPEETRGSAGRKIFLAILFLLMFAIGAALVVLFKP